MIRYLIFLIIGAAILAWIGTVLWRWFRSPVKARQRKSDRLNKDWDRYWKKVK